MNEDIHIEKAAHLADTPGAENLATDRAKKFVADALAAKDEEDAPMLKNFFVRRPVYAWGSFVMALAACVAIAVVLFRPTQDGAPGLLIENQNIHADTDVSDTTIVESSDTLVIESIIMPE